VDTREELLKVGLLCEIFRCSRKAEMYLYVAKETGLSGLPKDMLSSLGELHSVMMLRLHKERHLARADVSKVMAMIHEQGYYLQLPPTDTLITD
jgi:uncharacterized protein YcgL (UPF0745 family)